MGFYDCRCMVTGVSLKGTHAALVLLHQSAGEYAPFSLAIKGSYNRLGSIDGIEEDSNTRLILRFFMEGLRSGIVEIDEGYWAAHGCFPIRIIENLLQGFERNMNDGPLHATLGGQSVVFALIAGAVWDTIAQATPTPEASVSAVFQQLFGSSSLPARIYAGSLGEMARHIGELAAVEAFLRGRGLHWQPSEAAGQDYPEEMRQYLGEARQTFADSATILAALRRYAEEVGELLEDERGRAT